MAVTNDNYRYSKRNLVRTEGFDQKLNRSFNQRPMVSLSLTSMFRILNDVSRTEQPSKHSRKFRTKVGGAYFCHAPAHMTAYQGSQHVIGPSVNINTLVKPDWRRVRIFRTGILFMLNATSSANADFVQPKKLIQNRRSTYWKVERLVERQETDETVSVWPQCVSSHVIACVYVFLTNSVEISTGFFLPFI